MSVLFTSDLHLGHKTILKYRPHFNSIAEHDNHLLNQILQLSKRDVLFILGDFIFDSDKYKDYIKTLSLKKCRIKLILGNHDSLKLLQEPIFEHQLPLFSYKNMWLSHCPIHPQELRKRKLNVHGHLHNSQLVDNRYFDVSPEKHNYNLVTLDEIKDYYDKQN